MSGEREDNREREDHREDHREPEPYYTEPDDMEAYFDSQDQQREQREAAAEEYYVDAEGVTRSRSGTRKRMDGKGDPWANAHRDKKILPNYLYFQDIDGFAGVASFRDDTEDRLYFEYCLDSWKNKDSLIRNIAYVALFDRKQSESIAFSKGNILSTSIHLDLATKLGASQPIDPTFFYVVGQGSPWKMIELDIHTGERTGVSVILNDEESWMPHYKTAGLLDRRRKLTMWLNPSGEEDPTGRPDHSCDALAW